MKYRKSVSGVKLREFDHYTRIAVTTLCPSKWVLVDTQDGHVYGKQRDGGPWVTPTAATMRDARVCLAKAISRGEGSTKERPVHGAIYDDDGAHIACNKEMSLASGWEFTTDPDVPKYAITCKNCLRVLRLGVQQKLDIK